MPHINTSPDEVRSLYAASNKLTRASSPAEWLEAVSDYAREQGANSGFLLYIDDSDDQRPVWNEVVAGWSRGVDVAPVGTRFHSEDYRHFVSAWVSASERPTLIGDITTSHWIDEAAFALFDSYGTRALAVLPLNVKGRWVGVLMFTWDAPRVFDERDQRMFTAIIQQAAPVIASVRLLEETQRRATELETASSEIDILYSASRALAQASSPAELLQAVSDYARENGASYGGLTYLHGERPGPEMWGELMAEWTTGAGKPSGVGRRYSGYGEDFASSEGWTSQVDVPMLVTDLPNDERFHPGTREQFLSTNRRSVALLPLNNRGRWVGIITFSWDRPYEFSERDYRIYTALIQQATLVGDSLRLLEQSRERAARAEHLLKVNTALSQATSEPDMLNALALYTATQGARAITLNYLEYVDLDDPMQPSASWPVAVWEHGRASYYDTRSHQTAEVNLNDLWVSHPEQVLYVESVSEDKRLPQAVRRTLLESSEIRAFALLPLFSSGRYHAVIGIRWHKAHKFSAQEQYIYDQVLQSLSSIVASRRAYLAEEEARRESELLYRASEAVNAAHSMEGIVEAIDRLQLSELDILLNIYENYDFRDAGYIEFFGRKAGSGAPIHMKMGVMELPLAFHLDSRDPIVVEDTTDRTVIDDVTAATIEAQGHHAFLTIPLFLVDRWVGNLTLASRLPRKFTKFEIRVTEGIGDLVVAALERVRLRAETELDRARAEMLANVNAALSQATDEQAILSAVSALAEGYGVSLSTLAYLDIKSDGDLRAINMVALRSGDGRSPLPLNFLPVVYLTAEKYPILQVAYANPDEPTFIENMATDPRTEAGETRHFYAQLDWAAAILVPLRAGDQWQGLLTFTWNTPQTFTDDIRRLFQAVQSPASAVVASRRALLTAEEARHESELLYRASTAINAANTFEEIAQAVALLEGLNHSIALTIWENFDYDSATYFEVVATANNSPQQVGMRYPTSDFPLTKWMPRKGLWIIEDMTKDPRIDPQSAATWMKDGTYARIGFPLTLNNRWLGSLAFHYPRPKTYTEFEKRLVAGLGDLVTAAMERMRLQYQTEAARQRAEKQAQVNAALSQATDEWEILAAAALYLDQLQPDNIMLNYVEIDSSGEPTEIIPVAAWQSGGRNLNDRTLYQHFSLQEFPSMRLWMENPDKALLASDIASHPGADSRIQTYLLQEGFHAFVAIPLFSGGRWQGMIGCGWKTMRQFTAGDREICEALIRTVGAVVASRRAYLAQENARRETEMRARELEAIARMSAAATSILNQDELLEAVAYLTRMSFDEYHTVIYLLDESGEYLKQASSSLENGTMPERLPVAAQRSLVCEAARTRQGVIVGDITNTPEYKLTPLMPDARSEMAVPMVVADRLIGVLDIQSPKVDHFDEADIRVMATLADLIAVAIQNARLYQRAQEIAAFEERNRLARELHDSVSQALYGIALGTRTARILFERDPSRMVEPLDYVMSLAEAGLTEMRALIFELRPESLENEGLIMALTKQAASVQARHGVHVSTDMCEEPNVPFEVKEAVYRIAREALHNIVKHAHAAHVNLSMHCKDDGIHLDVRDDGRGFDPGGSFPGHLGLHSMRERAERLDGTFTIESAPDAGTHIHLFIPHNGS